MAGNPVRGEWFTIIRAGEYPGKYPITAEDISDMAEDYDLTHRVGTVGLGHPNFLDGGHQKNLARIIELKAVGDDLMGRLDKVDPELRVAYDSGSYPNWSGRIIPPHLSETKRMYLSGVDFLGVAQPAVAGMRVSFSQSLAESFCANPIHKDDTPNTKGDTDMTVTLEQVKGELTTFKTDAVDPLSQQIKAMETSLASVNDAISKLTTSVGELKKAPASPPNPSGDFASINDAIAKLSTKVDELSQRPSMTAEELKSLKDASLKVTDLSKKNDDLRSAEADRAVADATKGIPAGYCSDEKKAAMKQWYLAGDPAFGIAKGEYDKLRPTFANLSAELSPKGAGEADDISKQEGYMEGADKLANKRSVRAYAILKEKGIKKGDANFANELALAQQQAHKEIK